MYLSFFPHICRQHDIHSHRVDFRKLSPAGKKSVVWTSYSRKSNSCVVFDASLTTSMDADRNQQISVHESWLEEMATHQYTSCLETCLFSLHHWPALLSLAPPEVPETWIMTFLFRAGLSLSETLHHFGTWDKSKVSQAVFTSTEAALRLWSHVKWHQTSKLQLCNEMWGHEELLYGRRHCVKGSGLKTQS